MNRPPENREKWINHLVILSILGLFAVWLRTIHADSVWQEAGLRAFSLGFLLLLAYEGATTLGVVGFPLISGYIFAGMVAGPQISNLLTDATVMKLRLVDDLALSFIALTAGATLHVNFLRRRLRAITLNISFLTLLVFSLVCGFVLVTAHAFQFTRSMSVSQVVILASLLGVIAVARSPSSAIAIISESRASGVFTETVLGVTVAMDVLIIMLFTMVLTLTGTLLLPGAGPELNAFLALILETAVSFLIGGLLGKGIAFYIRGVGRDLPLFLLFVAFGVVKGSFWLDQVMEARFAVSLHLEPLLLCMSAGFTVQNFSKEGARLLENLDRISLPIYVLFFSLAGASLDLGALRSTWPLATSIAVIRGIGIFLATWLAGTLQRDPKNHNRLAWMAYITQAGVAIGLAQLAERQFPEIGTYLNTIVLAVITINQVVGPITFKTVLRKVGEAKSI